MFSKSKLVEGAKRTYRWAWVAAFLVSLPPLVIIVILYDIELLLGYLFILLTLRFGLVGWWRSNYTFSSSSNYYGSRDKKQLMIYGEWRKQMLSNPPQGFDKLVVWFLYGNWRKAPY
jgi:hypothetical protein